MKKTPTEIEEAKVLATAGSVSEAAQRKCKAHHTGPWMVEPEWFRNAINLVNKGVWQAQGQTEEPDDGESDCLYTVISGIAVVSIAGCMMKAKSKFGGTSTVLTRNAIRMAVNDADVQAILLQIDSPGGTVAGTDALAQDIAAADKQKPVYAHIEDMGASAAYYVASQAQRITASQGSLIGSLGSRMVVVDSSKAAEQDGIVVHDVSTGEFKGAGLEGTKITDRQLSYFQEIVDDANKHFKAAVMSGRKMSPSQVDALFDGRVHDAAKALTLGLIDQVSTLDAAVTAIFEKVKPMNADAFRAYAAEHPEAVAGYIEQGKKVGIADGIKQERDRFDRVLASASDNVALAIDAFKAGHDSDLVKMAADAVIAAKSKAAIDAKAQTDALAAKDAEIEKLKAQVAFTTTGQPPVGARQQSAADAAVAPEDPGDDVPPERRKAWAKEMATFEWDQKDSNAAKFSTKERYVAYRSQELVGNMKALTPASK